VEPYRSTKGAHSTPAHARGAAAELVVPFALLWIVSLFRLVTALVSGRAFGTIDTLAAIALVLLPWAVARGRVRMR
jgi:hypothetical protein